MTIELAILASGILIALGLSSVSSAIIGLANTIRLFYDDTQPFNSRLSSLVKAISKND
jgi:hypothetical protein